MKELKGSERQIAWAEKIRKQLVELKNDMEDKKEKVFETKEGEYRIKLEKSYKKTIERINDKLENEDSAKFYIEEVRDDMTNKATVRFTHQGRYYHAYLEVVNK